MESELVRKAREIAADVLKDELRHDGSPFMIHPDNVAKIVEDEIGLGEDCIAAVYLHEATRVHKEVDISGFPVGVRNMVDGLNMISTIKPKDTSLEAENYKKLIVQYSSDPRVVVLKIADRLEVMRNLAMFPKTSKDQKLLETLMLYMPLAHQIGLYNINSELSNIYFQHSEPEQFRAITNKLKATAKDREKLTAEFIEPLKKTLDNAGIKYKLKIREKSAYSIYKKMIKQNVPFEGVFDVFAIRFIIDSPDDPVTEKDLCWKVYSYVTEEYESDTARLRDWLTTPRPNGYESLHITVKNKQGAYLEVQIRTQRMDWEAENGQAAHWAYKGIRHEENLDKWMKSVRDILANPLKTKTEDIIISAPKDIFVFTPTGELRVLSAGASLLDFAFNIHSGLGCRCTGGRINGKAVQIKEKLKTGDVVEIQTSKNQKPSRDWLEWVVTSKARTKIKQELDSAERKKAADGREMLERRLKNWKLEFPDDIMRDFMQKRKISSNITFWAMIADDLIDVNEIKSFITEDIQGEAKAEEEKGLKSFAAKSGNDDILVLSAKNVKGMDYHLAKCCNPVFGDDVFGFVTRTEGIKIHRISCKNASRLIERYPYRVQKVVWQSSTETSNFQCTLQITADLDHPVLAKIMEIIGQFKASIRSFNVNENQRAGLYEISVRLLVPSNLELDKIISQLNLVRSISRVKRS